MSVGGCTGSSNGLFRWRRVDDLVAMKMDRNSISLEIKASYTHPPPLSTATHPH